MRRCGYCRHGSRISRHRDGRERRIGLSNRRGEEDEDDEDADKVVLLIGDCRIGDDSFAGDVSFVDFFTGDLATFLGGGAGTPLTAPFRIFTSMISPPSKSCTCRYMCTRA